MPTPILERAIAEVEGGGSRRGASTAIVWRGQAAVRKRTHANFLLGPIEHVSAVRC
jgi:hypothetical protein